MFRWQIALLLLFLWMVVAALTIETNSAMFRTMMPVVAMGIAIYFLAWSLILIFSPSLDIQDKKPQQKDENHGS